MSNMNIKDCPFCGSGLVKTIKGFMGKRAIFKVYCVSCQIRTDPKETKKLAIETWNKRVAL